MIRATHPDRGTKYRRVVYAGSYEPADEQEACDELSQIFGPGGWKFEVIDDRNDSDPGPATNAGPDSKLDAGRR